MYISTNQSLYLAILTVFCCGALALQSRRDQWEAETLGQQGGFGTSGQSAAQINSYKDNLLKYVLRTDVPSQISSGGHTTPTQVPYIMDKLYNLLANKTTGREKRSAPFEVDLIRGLEDHYETGKRMQFWFNLTAVNRTEDVIDCYFHIYKKRAPVIQSLRTHIVTVSLYKVKDETEMFHPNGSAGPGVVLLGKQIVSAYTGQWIVFKSNLKDTVKEWVRNPSKNKGFLLTATDSEENHVNGTHLDFIQRGESPQTQQPVFVLYTDQEKKKNSKHKKKNRKNIDYLIKNFLNEDERQVQTNRQLCDRMLGANNSATTNDCTDLLLRSKRSLIDYSVDIENEIITSELRSRRAVPRKSKRRSRKRHEGHRSLAAQRRQSEFCQVKSLYISFQAFGWGKWIVAPDGINTNFCDGTCPFPLTSTLTASNHAVLQSVSSHYHPDTVKPPCCVPQKLTRMTILFHQDDKTVTMRSYDNMIVESCGCR